jgi:cytochrome P450
MQCSAEARIDDTAIRTNLIGIILGCIPTTSKAVALVVDELLRRPAELAGAQAAARADDDDLVSAYVFEALRFRPQNLGLVRTCAMDYTVARGTLHPTTIPAGTEVLVATQSAMHDGRVVTHPGRFRTDRPPHHYLHFGAGLHTCFGRHVNQVQIPLIVKSLLRRSNLRRAPGPAGALRTTGPYPSSLAVRFD